MFVLFDTVYIFLWPFLSRPYRLAPLHPASLYRTSMCGHLMAMPRYMRLKEKQAISFLVLVREKRKLLVLFFFCFLLLFLLLLLLVVCIIRHPIYFPFQYQRRIFASVCTMYVFVYVWSVLVSPFHVCDAKRPSQLSKYNNVTVFDVFVCSAQSYV